MSDTIWAALISAIGGIIGSYLANRSTPNTPGASSRASHILLGALLGTLLGFLLAWSIFRIIPSITSQDTNGATPTVLGATPVTTPVPGTVSPPSATAALTQSPCCLPPTITPPVTTNRDFTFETTAEGWGTSEGQFKLATVERSQEQAQSGTYALKLLTDLIGTANASPDAAKEVYQHTEVTAYFDRAIPPGRERGPYALGGAHLSCFVYLPPELASGGGPVPFIRLFAKDTSFRNNFGKASPIDGTRVGRWTLLELDVGAQAEDLDRGFDDQAVNTLGVRIDIPPGSTLNFHGAIYLDDCSLGGTSS